MKRLWPLPVLLLLALPARAQVGDEGGNEPAAAEELAPPEGEAPAPTGAAPDGEGASPTAGDGQGGGAAPNGGEEGRDPAEKPEKEKEKPFISIIAADSGESLEPDQPVKKAVADATLIKGPKKTRGPKASADKVAKIKTAPSPVLKPKAPVVVAPPPVPVSAVPITPITPRNP